MKIALCQMENKGSVQENLEGSLRAVREAASQHADLRFSSRSFFHSIRGRMCRDTGSG